MGGQGMEFKEIQEITKPLLDANLREYERTIQLIQWMSQRRYLEIEGTKYSIAPTSEGDLTVIYSDFSTKETGKETEKWVGVEGAETNFFNVMKHFLSVLTEEDFKMIETDLNQQKTKQL